MVDSLDVLWTIVPRFTPQPWLICSRCARVRAFRSSQKFRINANGRRLDAWLIYKCTSCDNTWNRPVLERRHIGSVDPRHLVALQMNDPLLARRLAFDLGDLRQKVARIEESAAVLVHKDLLSGSANPVQRLEIRLAIPEPPRLRLDRLLATELGLPRPRIKSFCEDKRLVISPDGARMLRKPLRDGTALTFDLSHESDGAAIIAAATGPSLGH
ncbi:MAG: DUF1062 domain-containing protein [Kiloniellaceae bacterium]